MFLFCIGAARKRKRATILERAVFSMGRNMGATFSPERMLHKENKHKVSITKKKGWS
jgi:hypothetical protein